MVKLKTISRLQKPWRIWIGMWHAYHASCNDCRIIRRHSFTINEKPFCLLRSADCWEYENMLLEKKLGWNLILQSSLTTKIKMKKDDIVKRVLGILIEEHLSFSTYLPLCTNQLLETSRVFYSWKINKIKNPTFLKRIGLTRSSLTRGSFLGDEADKPLLYTCLWQSKQKHTLRILRSKCDF